jgi:hypothetical protein
MLAAPAGRSGRSQPANPAGAGDNARPDENEAVRDMCRTRRRWRVRRDVRFAPSGNAWVRTVERPIDSPYAALSVFLARGPETRPLKRANLSRRGRPRSASRGCPCRRGTMSGNVTPIMRGATTPGHPRFLDTRSFATRCPTRASDTTPAESRVGHPRSAVTRMDDHLHNRWLVERASAGGQCLLAVSGQVLLAAHRGGGTSRHDGATRSDARLPVPTNHATNGESIRVMPMEVAALSQ